MAYFQNSWFGKVDNSHSVAFLIKTPVIESYVVWCDAKNRYQKDMCLKEIKGHVQNKIPIPGEIER